MNFFATAQKVLNNYDGQKFYDNLSIKLNKMGLKKGAFCKKIGKPSNWIARRIRWKPEYPVLIVMQELGYDILKLVEIKQEELQAEKGKCIPLTKPSQYLDRLKMMIQEYIGNTDYKKYAEAAEIPWTRFKKYTKGEFPTAEDLLRICILSERSPFWLIWGFSQKTRKQRLKYENQEFLLEELLQMTEEILATDWDEKDYLLRTILTSWQRLKKDVYPERKKKRAS
jgi:hypothetical protein